MDDLPKMMGDPESRLRRRAIELLADKYFGKCIVIPSALEDALIGALKGDPDPEVRRFALEKVSSQFEWWGDSPIGPVNLRLRERILSTLPASLGEAADIGLARAVGEILGRLGAVRDLAKVPDVVSSCHAFKEALLDGLSRRELYEESESLLQQLVQDTDVEIRRGAQELLDDH